MKTLKNMKTFYMKKIMNIHIKIEENEKNKYIN